MIKSHEKSLRMAVLILAILIAPLLSSYKTTADYGKAITLFQKASSSVIASARTYMVELNKTERDHYISQQFQERKPIRLYEIEKVEVFTKEGLEARLRALDQLEKYGNLLLSLANNQAPQNIETEAKNLGDAVTNLNEKIKTLSGKKEENSKFGKDFGPAAEIFGQVASLIIRGKILKELKETINKGEKPINVLIAAIRSDITIAYELKRNALSIMRVDLTDEFNKELKLEKDNPEPEKLLAWKERIIANEDSWEAFTSANPAEGLNAMIKAHSALVTYANSSQKLTDFASLVTEMELFANRAESLDQAVQALRKLNSKK